MEKMNRWRMELTMMLAECEARRPPVLRRSRREDYLYCSDLPGIAAAEAVNGFILKAEQAGWEAISDAGWIQMRRRIPELPEDWYIIGHRPETGMRASNEGEQHTRAGAESEIKAGQEFGTEIQRGRKVGSATGASDCPETGYRVGWEIECCASLLSRHQKEKNTNEWNGAEEEGMNGEREIIALIKAGEEGEQAVEKLCRGLHEEWAARLRRNEALPRIPAERLRYL